MRAIDLAKLVYEKRKKFFDNWRYYVEKIKEFAEAELGEVEVYVFSSVVRGEAHPVPSDIDVLMVSLEYLKAIKRGLELGLGSVVN